MKKCLKKNEPSEQDAGDDVIYIGLKLNKRTDEDIIEAIGCGGIRQSELKRLMRIGIKELHRKQNIRVRHKDHDNQVYV